MIISVERQYLPQKNCVVCGRPTTTIDRILRIEDAHVVHVHDRCVDSMKEITAIAKCPICYVYEESQFVEVPFRRVWERHNMYHDYTVRFHRSCLKKMLVYHPPVKPCKTSYYEAKVAGRTDLIRKYFPERHRKKYKTFWEQYHELLSIENCTSIEVKKGRRYFRVKDDTLYISPKQWDRELEPWYSQYGDKPERVRVIAAYLYNVACKVLPRGVCPNSLMDRIVPKLEELL